MKTRQARPVLEEFEPRILYSADFAPAALAGVNLAGASEQRLLQAQEAPAVTLAAAEIAFVDLSLPDAQSLIDDLQAQRDAGRPIEVVRIGAAEDGITRISETLAGRTDVSAVHVLSHGDDGVLQLGSARLDAATLLARAGELAQWSAALSADADLLLYGCDVAQSAAGEQFVNNLGALTGADVASSTDLTGAAAQGGNWTLEYSTGRIEAWLAIDAAGQQTWTGTLAVAFTSESSDGTTSATTSYDFSHNVNSGSDRLLLVELVIANGVDASSVSFNGNALTLLARQDSPSGHVGVEVWYLVAPPVVSGTVNVTLASASTLAVGATSYSGVSQSTPLGTPVAVAGIIPVPVAVVAANTGDLVVDIVGARSVFSNGIGPGQTQNFVQNQGTGATDLFAVSSREAGAASVTMGHAFTSTDGNWASIAVEINQAVNAAPVVGTTGGSLAYTENQAATAIDPGLTASDADSATLTGATVSISANYANGQDVLAFTNQLGITGSWNASTGVLTLSGTATVADYQSALRTVTYANGSDDPSILTRTVSFVVNDGTAPSVAANKTVTVSAVVDHVLKVDTANDTMDGVTTSIDALLANRGADGFISLREAIIAANNTGGLDTINFDIGGGGSQAISLLAALPTISGSVVIDGTSQVGFAGVPLIELKGNNLNTDGLSITGGGSTVRGLVINGFQKFGISLSSVGNNVIQGNYIGTNPAGTAALANRDGGIKITTANNLIGGTSAADRNVISGNGSGDVPGISISGAAAQGNLIQGNYIGVNAAGTSGVPNSGSGIDIYGGAGTTTIGGTVAGAGNVISGNDTGSDGIWINGGSGNVIQGNLIGTDTAGVAAVPNDYSGIYIDASSDNSIGGTTPGAGNVIAYATNGGVIIIGNSSQRNAILGNSIYGNTGLGIDLREDGISINDGTKSGSANAGMDSPVFTAATLDGSTLTLTGYVGSAAGQALFAGARVEVFVSDVDVSGYGEGRTYLGALTADASGNFAGSLTVGGVSVGNSLTATATDAAGSTSEFGANRVVASGVNAPPTATNLSAPETYTEDTPLNLTAIVVSDVNSANVTATLTLSNVAAGSLSTSTSGAVTSNYDTGTGVWTASGAINDVNTLLAGLTFTPSVNFNGNFTIATSISDGSLGVTGSKAVTGTAVNDAPLASGGASLAAVNEDTLSPTGATVASLFGANFSDPADAGNPAQSQFAGVVVRGQSVDAAEGRWEYSTDGGTNWSNFGFISDTNSIELGLSDRLRFLPAANYQGTPNDLSVRLVDNSVAIASGATVDASSNGGSSAFSAAVVVTSTSVSSVNDAPTISLPAAQATAMNGVLVLSAARGNAITVGDADAGTGSVEVTLGATQGSLTLSRTGGLTFVTGDGSADALMRFTGTLADVNDALDGLRFTPSTGYLGAATLSIGIDDLGNSGSGGPLSASATLAVEVADDRLVNTVTSGNQTEPATAMDAAGNYVVTWTSDGQDGGGKGIFAQRYDAAGNVVGAAFRVNTTTAGDQTASSVAMAEGGEFVVVWTSADGAGKGLYAQRYDNNGVAQGGQFQVNTLTPGDQVAPSVAMAADGSFVVAWASDSGSSRFDVYARRYDAGGVAAGIEVRVNTAVDKNQFQPAVAMHPSGAFVVAWTSTSPSDGSGTGVYAQRFAANGTTAGGEFRVNSTTAGNQDRPALAIGPDGGFVVAWTSGDGLDGDKSGIFGQRYAADGSALGAEFQVNTFANDSQSLPTVAFDDAGAFTVAWSSKNQDGNGWGVFAQQFDSGGVRVGLEYRVNATTGGDQTAAAVAAGQSGQLLVVWQGNGPEDNSGIFQRLNVAPNDAPAIAVPGAQTTSEDTPLVWSSANGNRISITDIDAFGQPVQVSLSVTQGTLSLASAAGLSFGTGTGSGDTSMSFSGTLAAINAALDGLRFDPTADFAGAAALSITVDDQGHSGSGGALSANATVAITVAAVNDAPTLAQALADQTASQGVAFVFTVPAGSFADVDAGDVLTYSATLASGAALPTWLSFDAATRTFSGTPANADVGAIDVRVTATDTANASAFDDFRLTVGNVNDAPTVAAPIADQSATQGAPFSFSVPSSSFADIDAGDALTYSATLASGAALPTWLSFDAATQTFSGTPTNADVGAIDVRVTATDGSSASVFDDFRLTVGNVNDAPTVAAPIADQPATQGAPFSFSVPGGSFADVDAGDALTYSATLASGAALPTWLSFDAATRTFNGTPANADVGAISVRVTATDTANASVFDDFTLTVANVNDAPVITSNGGTPNASISVAENNTTVTTVTATDVDQPAQPLSYSISGGADAARFTIDAATGVLSFVAAPDFEAPTDANGDNVYDVIVQVSDGGLTDTQAIAVTVTAVNDNAPVITSDGGGATAVLGRAENATSVTTVTATDADALDVLRFAITGGADAARFSIDPVNGALSFVAAPDVEAPADANADNRYEVTVTVSDGTLSAQQALLIDVGNVDEAPTIVTNVLLLSKDGATIVLLGTDPDTAASALNYQVSGQVGGRFELVAAPGVAVTGFSQAQVDAGAVRFAADGSGAGPTYVLSLSDGVSTVISGAPTVVVQPPAVDVPAAVPATPTPAPTPDPAPATTAAAPADPQPAAPPVWLPAAPDSLSRALVPEPRDDPFEPARAASSSAAVAPPAASTATRDSTVTAVATLAQFALLSESSDNAGTVGAPTIDLASALRDRLLGEQLDQQRESAESSQRSAKDVQAASAVMTAGLSVGYVLWLARGGVLVASLMSALPAWAMVDPLPVLAQMKRRDGDTGDDGADGDADDPLEKLFSKARQVVARGSSTPTPATATQTPPAPGHVAVDVDSLEQPA